MTRPAPQFQSMTVANVKARLAAGLETWWWNPRGSVRITRIQELARRRAFDGSDVAVWFRSPDNREVRLLINHAERIKIRVEET